MSSFPLHRDETRVALSTFAWSAHHAACRHLNHSAQGARPRRGIDRACACLLSLSLSCLSLLFPRSPSRPRQSPSHRGQSSRIIALRTRRTRARSARTRTTPLSGTRGNGEARSRGWAGGRAGGPRARARRVRPARHAEHLARRGHFRQHPLLAPLARQRERGAGAEGVQPAGGGQHRQVVRAQLHVDDRAVDALRVGQLGRLEKL